MTAEKELMVFRRRRETDDFTDEDEQAGLDGIFADADDAATDGVAGAPDAGRGDRAAASALAGPNADSDTGAGAAKVEPYAVAVPLRPKGPWDSQDVPKDDAVARVDLGGIHLPVPDGLEVRVEVQDDVPMAATLVDGDTALQVHAFAAPKSSGLWVEVRDEISQSLQGAGGSAETAEGPFGAELRARIPADDGMTQPARFIGVDGPRWFLRGLLTGPGSTDSAQARRLEDAFRQIVVHRGSDAMAPRDMLPLHLPREALEGMPPPPDPDNALQLPERGPEITEIQ